jgi:hypothetical protein
MHTEHEMNRARTLFQSQYLMDHVQIPQLTTLAHLLEGRNLSESTGFCWLSCYASLVANDSEF